MASLNGRVSKLEGRISPPVEAGEEARRLLTRAILDEFGRLRACRAQGYRGGDPPTPIQPTDPAGDALGYPYTTGELFEFATRRVVERLEFSPEERDRIVTSWVGSARPVFEKWWDEVQAEGPPEPTPPYR